MAPDGASSGGGPNGVLDDPQALQTVSLRDGRTVSYSTCGSQAPGAHTILFLHPVQGNRYMPLVLHPAAQRLNLRVVALDRPGVGASSPVPGRSVREYAADVAELCDLLGIRRFGVMCSSAGTMYALACTLAPETRDRLVGKVTVVAPWVPVSSRHQAGGGWLHALGSWVPTPLLSAFVGLQNNLVYKQSLHKPVTDLMTRSSPEEVAAFAQDEAFEANNAIYKAMIAEWGRSHGGIVQEMQLCMERPRRLYFDYARDVTAPVRVFAGTADAVMPYSDVASWAARAAGGGVELITVQGGTHDGLMHTHKVAALEALARDAAAAAAVAAADPGAR